MIEKYDGVNPLIKFGLLNSGVFGHVDIVDDEKIAGWILDRNMSANAKEIFPRVSINYLPNDLEFFRIDVLNANLLNGKLVIDGLALPRKDAGELKLTVKDAEGIKDVQWGLPSLFFGEQRKDNPRAKNARFSVDNVVVGDEPIEVFVDGKKVAEIVIQALGTF